MSKPSPDRTACLSSFPVLDFAAAEPPQNLKPEKASSESRKKPLKR